MRATDDWISPFPPRMREALLSTVLPSSTPRMSFYRAALPEFVLVVVFAVLGLGLGAVAPRNTTFYEQDPALSKERFDPQVPSWLLGILAALFPGILCVSYDLFSGKGSFWVTLGLCQSLSLTLLITDTVKNFVGSKRPNFFDLVNYSNYAAAIDTHDTTSSAWQTYKGLTTMGAPGSLSKASLTANFNDAMRSFPSGHASISFAGLVYLGLVIRAAAGVKSVDTFSPYACLAGLPPLLAAFIAITRIQDNWHREVDIGFGALIGTVAAFAAWHHARGAGRIPPPLWGGVGKGRGEGEGGVGVEVGGGEPGVTIRVGGGDAQREGGAGAFPSGSN